MKRPAEQRTRFYGMDLYSLRASIGVVLEYLGKIDPDAAWRARYRYSCFDHFGEDVQAYGDAATFGLSRGCEEEVVEQLVELRRRTDYANRDGRVAQDDYFFSEQNARVVLNAERCNARPAERAWSCGRTIPHLGDARATDMGSAGKHNVGQLTRQRRGGEAVLVGFTTHTGTVTAASDWDGAAERKQIVPSLEGSCERMLHDAGIDKFFVALDEPGVRDALMSPRLERAIGVIYLPRTERVSHDFRASLPRQFDLVVHIDRTHALTPLETWAHDHTGEPAGTFPSGV